MKTLILGGSNSRNSGGVFNSARTLGLSLSKFCGTDVHFLMHSDEYSDEDRKYYEPLPLHNYNLIGPNNLGYSDDIYKKICEVKPDVIHTQSIWMYLSYANYKYYKKTKTPYIIAPRGMLDPWQLTQSVFKKKLALWLYENSHLKNAACIHALCKDEFVAMRSFGLKNPIAIIPNGVYLPDANVTPSRTVQANAQRKTLLFLSRIHVKKGLDNLIKAWALTKPDTHNWRLVIAGETKDSVYMQSLKDMAGKLNVGDTIEFVGGQFGKQKNQAFIDADAFTLPSFSEGLPMAVLEAWSYKLPAVITPFCNLPEGFEADAAIQIDVTAESIAEGIKQLVGMTDEERTVMGENGYNLVKDKFTWEQIAKSTLKLYEWVVGKVEMPDFVHLS